MRHIRERLKTEMNETLFDLLIGIGILFVLFLVAGLFLSSDKIGWLFGMLLGCFTAAAMAVHMYVSMDRAMDYGENGANKIAVRNSLIRFVFMAVVLFIGLKVDNIQFIGVILGILTLKFSALIQPFINKKITTKLYG